MEIEIIREKKSEIEFRIKERDPILAEVLTEFLNKDKDVEFASYVWEHPLAGYPKVIVKAKDPKKSIKKAIKAALKELKELKKGLKVERA